MKIKLAISQIGVTIFLISFFMPRLSLEIGFFLKLFMILSLIFLIRYCSELRFKFFAYDFILLILFLYGGFTVIFSQDIVSGFRLFIGSILVFGCYKIASTLFFLKMKVNPNYLINLINHSGLYFITVSLTTYVVGIALIYDNLANYESVPVFGVVVDRGIPRMIGLTEDPNIFAFSCIIFIFSLYFKSTRLMVRDKLTLTLLFISTLLSVSRGGIITISLVILIFWLWEFITQIKSGRISINQLRTTALALIGLFFLYMFLKSNEVVWGMILQRIETAADGSGRFEIFKNAIDIWQQHFLFGIGWYNFLHYNINYYGMSNYVHNTHLEVLVELGIIGFTIYVLFHFLLLRAIIKIIRKDSRYFFYLPVYIGFLIMMSSLSLIINETFFIFVALVAATLMSMKIQPSISFWKRGLSVDNNCNINHK